MSDSFTLERTPHRVVADAKHPRTVLVTHGSPVYFGPDPGVSAESHKGVIKTGKAKTFKAPVWLASATQRWNGYPEPATQTTEDSIRLQEAFTAGEDLRELDTRRVQRSPIEPGGSSVVVPPAEMPQDGGRLAPESRRPTTGQGSSGSMAGPFGFPLRPSHSPILGGGLSSQ